MKKYTDQGKVDTRSGFGAGLLVFSMLFVLTSCSANIEGKVEPNQNPHRIELKEALTHLDAFLLEYAVQTKSENCPERHYSMDGVSEVKSSKIFPSDTKSDESCWYCISRT